MPLSKTVDLGTGEKLLPYRNTDYFPSLCNVFSLQFLQNFLSSNFFTGWIDDLVVT